MVAFNLDTDRPSCFLLLFPFSFLHCGWGGWCPSYGVRHKAWLPLLLPVWHTHTRTKEKKQIKKRGGGVDRFQTFSKRRQQRQSFFFSLFLRCVFLYNPNFFQMLPTPPFRIFVIFFFLFCSGREEEEEEEDYDVCVCVCTPFLPCFMKGFVLLLPAPLSFVDSLFIPEERTRQRRLVYSFFFSFRYVYK
jgi:hypothetical protein